MTPERAMELSSKKMSVADIILAACAEQREEDAKICEDKIIQDFGSEFTETYSRAARHCADAIRQQGKQEAARE